MLQPLIILLAVIGAGVVVYALAKTTHQKLTVGNVQHARKTFSLRREWLEADFLTQARRSGKPRGLEWSNCDFENDVAFARDRSNGQLRALVGVTISFTAIPGGGMEEVEAVGNLRCATAVFRYQRGNWLTDGRAIFNLRPDEAIEHFGHELKPVS